MTKIRNTRRVQTHACKRDLGRHVRDLGNLGVQEHKHNKMQEGSDRMHTVFIPQPMLISHCVSHTTPAHAPHKMSHTREDGDREQLHTKMECMAGETLHTSNHATLTLITRARGVASWAQGGQDGKILLNQFAHALHKRCKERHTSSHDT